MEGFTRASTPGRQVPGMASEISFGEMALEVFTGQSQAETLQKESTASDGSPRPSLHL